jgi:hypothetical protein
VIYCKYSLHAASTICLLKYPVRIAELAGALPASLRVIARTGDHETEIFREIYLQDTGIGV